MSRRTLHLVRHGHADALGRITDEGSHQSRLIGRRLASLPVDVIWHSPLTRAADSARLLAEAMPGVLVDEAAELVDHVPFVPDRRTLSPSWAGFFDGYSGQEAAAGADIARALVSRFGRPNSCGQRPTHEVLVTHAYPIAWLVREALDAPPDRWMSLSAIANAALTTLEMSADEPPGIIMVNDMSHLPPGLRWTGFPGGGLA